jgi:hypothetical protein
MLKEALRNASDGRPVDAYTAPRNIFELKRKLLGIEIKP